MSTERRAFLRWAAVPAVLLVTGAAPAQEEPVPGGVGAPTARESAPQDQDLTGYWVAVVTQHWHYRMRMPPRGTYAKIPLNAEGRRVAEAWDPAADQANGEACRSYGAGHIMRVPGRLHIHWADDDTLQVDTDSGTQTRLFRFADPTPMEPAAPSWQGYSAAAWLGQNKPPEGDRYAAFTDPNAPRYLVVTTTRLRPGYLLKNGVPYSEDARVEEHFYTFTEPNGDTWLVVTTIITDPRYLIEPYVTTNQFKKQADDSGWDPTPCRVDHPR